MLTIASSAFQEAPEFCVGTSHSSEGGETRCGGTNR